MMDKCVVLCSDDSCVHRSNNGYYSSCTHPKNSGKMAYCGIVRMYQSSCSLREVKEYGDKARDNKSVFNSDDMRFVRLRDATGKVRLKELDVQIDMP